MRLRFFLTALISFAAGTAQLAAQDLAPRAYIITPVHANAVTVTWSFFDGGVNFNGTVPIANATGTYYVPILSYYHSLNFFGRSANVTASLPYGVGNFKGDVAGQPEQIYRSGLLDAAFRLSVNLLGGRAMQAKEMASWKQRRLLGVSLKVVAPTGQYDPTKLVNWGAIGGLLSQKLGIPNAGATGYLTPTRRFGSTPGTRSRTMGLSSPRRRKPP